MAWRTSSRWTITSFLRKREQATFYPIFDSLPYNCSVTSANNVISSVWTLSIGPQNSFNRRFFTVDKPSDSLRGARKNHFISSYINPLINYSDND